MSGWIGGVLESSAGSPVLLLVKATLLLVVAGVVAGLLPGRAAAARHLVWTVTMAMLLVLPLATWGAPEWRVPVVRVEQPSSVAGGAAHFSPSASPDSPLLSAARGSPAGDRSAGAPGAVGVAGKALRLASSSGGILAVWATGAAVVLAWLLIGQLLLGRVLRGAAPIRGDGWEEARRDAEWLLEVERPARLFRSPSVRVPVTWGVLRPVVVLPAEAESWPEARRRAVLLHELSHVARHDGLTQLVAGLACAIYWFHPGVWYGARRMRVEREHACDDLVLSAGTPGSEYAAHLLEVARGCRRTLSGPMLALPMARPSHLEGRLLRVLDGPSGRRAPTGRRAATVAAGMLVLTMPLAAFHPTTIAGGTDSPPATSGEPEAPGEPAAPGGREATVAALEQPVVVSDTPPNTRRQSRSGTIHISDAPDSVARFIPRLPLSAATFAITTRDGQTALLLRDTTIVLQLTDRGLEEIGRLDPGAEEEDFLKALLGSMLRGGLRMLLDRGLEYSLSDVGEARYDGGRLVLENQRGKDIFDDIQIGDGPIMEGFTERDARAFAQRVNAARARVR